MDNLTLEELVVFLKEKGFIFPGSEIYGGLANSFDYGPLGATLIKNIKDSWWKAFVDQNPLNVGLDSSILLNKEVFVASGHLKNFSDPLVDCKHCKARFRADKLLGDIYSDLNFDTFKKEDFNKFIKEKAVKCPKCGTNDFTDVREFNLMFKTHQGVVEDNKSEIYLRPETAQGIFINFKNVERYLRRKIPFGIGQIGKSFRNEITPGNFIFRTREFEQMELEFFCKPGTELEWFSYWQDFCLKYLDEIGVDTDRLRVREHEQEELSFYSNKTSDIEFLFPFGFGELWGIASRTDYDLKTHMEHAKCNLTVLDPETNEKYIPYVVEPSVGVSRLLLAVLFSAFKKQGDREILALKPALAPYHIAVLPLIAKKHSELAQAIYCDLLKHFRVDYDQAGNIGKRYRRQDTIGTPLCLTVDDESLDNGVVTLRDRDTQEQVTVPISELALTIRTKLQI